MATKKIKIEKINEITTQLEQFYALMTSDSELTFDNIYTTKNKPTKADVGLGSLPDEKSSVLDSPSEEILATVNGLKKLKDLIDSLNSSLSNTNTSLNNHNHNSIYLGINAKAADSDRLDNIDSSRFIYGKDSTGNLDYFSSDINLIAKSGFYNTNTTTVGLPSGVSATGTLIVSNPVIDKKEIIYMPDFEDRMFLFKDNGTDRWLEIPIGTNMNNVIYGTDNSATTKFTDISCDTIIETGTYSITKESANINSPNELDGLLSHLESSEGYAIQRFTEKDTLNEYIRIKINNVWQSWNLILAKSMGNEVLINQSNHGFEFPTPVHFNGSSFEATDLSLEKTCDGIANAIDGNNFYLLTSGTFEIPAGMTDESGNQFENGYFYYLDQLNSGKLTKARTQFGISQTILKVIYFNGKQYGLVNLSEPEQIMSEDIEQTSVAINSLTEANNIRITGQYTFNSVDTPTGMSGYLHHIQSSLNGGASVQTFYPANDDFRVYTRKMINSAWTSWKQISVEISADGLADNLNNLQAEIDQLQIDSGNVASLQTNAKILSQAINELLTIINTKVTNTLKINGHTLSEDFNISQEDLGIVPDLQKPISTATQSALDLKVDKQTTINTKPLSSNIVLTPSDLGIIPDLEKPISTATQNALNLKIDKSSIGIANGIAPLDSSMKVPMQYLYAQVEDVIEKATIDEFPIVGMSETIYLDLSTNLQYRWTGTQYSKITTGEVTSVNGEKGIVTVTIEKLGFGNIDNTSDLNKPISIAAQTVLNDKVSLTANETISGTKTFSLPIVISSGNSTFKQATFDSITVNGDISQSKSTADTLYYNIKNSSTTNGSSIGISSSGKLQIIQKENLPIEFHTNNVKTMELTAYGDLYLNSNKVSLEKNSVYTNNGSVIDISGTDLNNLVKTGVYDGLNLANSPSLGVWWYVEVMAHSNGNNHYILQKITGLSEAHYIPTSFIRRKINGVWQNWTNLTTYNDFTINNRISKRKYVYARYNVDEINLATIKTAYNRTCNVIINGSNYLGQSMAFRKEYIIVNVEGSSVEIHEIMDVEIGSALSSNLSLRQIGQDVQVIVSGNTSNDLNAIIEVIGCDIE